MDYFACDDYDVAEGYSSPFEEIGIDFETQTGADWMRIMLAASMGGVVLEGVSLAGSSEVIFKTDFETADKVAVGRIKYVDKPKMVESVDIAGTMVAKATAKFRGVGRANAFGLAMEDTLWSSSSVSRVRDAAFLAASMVAMGTKMDKAVDFASDILGEELPADLIGSVVTPLSLAKRDAATTVKNRSMVFLPQYALQPVIWDDTPLQGRLIADDQAIDWGRVTGIAKYIGAINSLLDPRFKEVAATMGVPYRLVKGHAATVTNAPYRVADNWKPIERIMSPFGSSVKNASNIAEAVASKIRLTVADMAGFDNGFTATALLTAMASARVIPKAKFAILAPGTDMLLNVRKTAFTPQMAARLTIGTDSAFNAIIASAGDKARTTVGATEKLASVLDAVKKRDRDESILEGAVKRAGEAVLTGEVFVDAAARLANQIGSEGKARERVSKARRSLFSNSSALADTVVVSNNIIPQISGIIRKIAKDVVLGNTGMLVPPPILKNPNAALEAHAAIELVNSAIAYLALAKDYWSNRYARKSEFLLKKDKNMSIKLAVASKAMKGVKTEWLLSWNDNFLPAKDLDESYLVDSVKNYTRKRSEDKDKIKPILGENAKDYAARVDKLLKPALPFTEVVEFVTEKIKMLAEDFHVNKEFKEEEEEELIESEPEPEPEPVKKALPAHGLTFEQIMEEMARINAMPDPEKTIDDLIATWKGYGDYEDAARDNGYANFEEAFAKLKLLTVFDEENTFTKAYFRGSARRAMALAEAGELDVI